MFVGKVLAAGEKKNPKGEKVGVGGAGVVGAVEDAAVEVLAPPPRMFQVNDENEGVCVGSSEGAADTDGDGSRADGMSSAGGVEDVNVGLEAGAAGTFELEGGRAGLFVVGCASASFRLRRSALTRFHFRF